jgi:hypothetical protein
MMNEIDGFEVFNERVLESKTQKVELAFGFGLRIFHSPSIAQKLEGTLGHAYFCKVGIGLPFFKRFWRTEIFKDWYMDFRIGTWMVVKKPEVGIAPNGAESNVTKMNVTEVGKF